MEKNGNMNKSLKTYDNLCKFTSYFATILEMDLEGIFAFQGVELPTGPRGIVEVTGLYSCDATSRSRMLVFSGKHVLC